MRSEGMRRVRLGPQGVAALFVWAASSSCGRTGLPLFDDDEFSTDGESPVGPEGPEAEAPFDAGPSLDALPSIDVAVPPNSPPPVACADASATLIYLISEQSDLFSFDPSMDALTPIARINCPAMGICPSTGLPATPFSMAVNQAGLAYIVYCNGQLFQVSTADGHCEPTGFASQQLGFPPTFGMGFTQNPSSAAETLYVAGAVADGGDAILGSIDTTTFALSVVGAFSPSISQPELTGTATGGLFGFYAINLPDGGIPASSGIAQIDPFTAALIGNVPLPVVMQGYAWAFAFWGGDFYTFTAPLLPPWDGNHTRVQRYRPSDGTIVDVLTITDQIVGAGVSTCAPQQ